MNGQELLFASLGVDLAAKREMPIDEKWLCYSLNHDNLAHEVPIILIKRGPKNIAEVKNKIKNIETCIVFFEEKNILFLKSMDESHITTLENDSEYERIASILKSTEIDKVQTEFDLQLAIKKSIDEIPNATSDFVNRGLFSTHYLRSRIFEDTRQNIQAELDKVKQKIGNTNELLRILGWDISNSSGSYYDGTVSITITDQSDFNIKKNKNTVASSYTSVATLRQSQWAILTNGKKWRLYSAKISASSTNYFEITLDPTHDNIIKYLIMLFSASSFKEKDEKRDVDVFFDEGKNYSTELEENLSDKIMSPDGLFLDLIKGILGHNMKKIFTVDELDSAKQTALKIMYRIWFLAYAESRNLLPTKDKKYKPISLQSIRSHLDAYEQNDDNSCWAALLQLFKGIRNGSKEHNLPQYSGNLFKNEPSIDSISIQNKFVARALRNLLERDGETVDYTNLSVRHLGNIFETLMEFSVKQAEKDLMLLENESGVKEVKTEKESTYSYQKNDLYLISKAGSMSRKTSASFYTPNKIVEFLVKQGLTPIFEEREKLIGKDLKKYNISQSDEDRQICMDRILDIQVLDPSMGSGHFLVEALNRLTVWATDMLKKHPTHPLLEEIESDQKTVISEQKKKGITIDANLLTHDVLLKRKIMKRCIFGVDLNPMAVDLAKLSLWLDSFAIGVPLTYMDHHIKHGDSTIGMFLDDLNDKTSHTLDDWMPGTKSHEMISDVICSSDITVEQVRASEDKYNEYKKSLEPTRQILDALAASNIDPQLLPSKGKNEFIYRFGLHSKTESEDFIKTRHNVHNIAERHGFFHWEIEMMDAFADLRRGYDLIVGNPPWEKIKPYDDEFFTPYDLTFRSLKPNSKKKIRKDELLHDPDIKKSWKFYDRKIKEKNTFYKTYQMQSTGDKDLWKLVMERMLKLVSKNGIISIVIPSQFLSNIGTVSLRKSILDRDILSLYVFENRQKIFPIHSRYRFVLLSARNSKGSDEFPVGFYLHDLGSLDDKNKTPEKFDVLSKKAIISISPEQYTIPETIGDNLAIFIKISQKESLISGLDAGYRVEITSGFHKTNDADLLLKNKKGWTVLEGKNIHQYNHEWSRPEFVSDKQAGLKRLDGVKVFDGKCKEIHDSFRLVFRRVSSPTNLRTCISTIVPPHVFHSCTLFSFVITKNTQIILDVEYNKKIAYLCGILNSLVFDFASRAKIQMDLPTIIKSLPIPKSDHGQRIAELATKLIVGTSEFEGFAESLRIPNKKLSVPHRIEITAEIDALVAHSYDLTIDEYKTIIDSFKSFKKNPALYNLEEIVWDNNNLKEFYGEMADLALAYFEAVTEDQK